MVTVVGLGFVGLTTALGFAEYGQTVYGIEINEERFETIRSGKLPFFEPGLDEALLRHLNRNFIPTRNWEKAVAESECIYYCVGTPYGENGQADLTYLTAAVKQTLEAVKDDRFRVLVTKSTIPPSTTKEKIIPFVESLGYRVPESIGVANNPEFLREGHCWEDFVHADRIVLGVEDARSEEILRRLYGNAPAPVIRVSLNTGEFIKYLSNTSLACLISYANEMSLAADAIGGIDTAAAFRVLHMDNRWQSGSIRNYCYPGCGYGGYCLPKDTNAFYAVAKNAGFEGKILKNVIDLNDSMPGHWADRICALCGDDRETCIGILGLSFNAGSDDVRDTPAARIIDRLNARGYRNIVAYDPMAMEEFMKRYALDMTCLNSREEVVAKADILAVVTAWPEFSDLKEKTDKPVADCRYMLR